MQYLAPRQAALHLPQSFLNLKLRSTFTHCFPAGQCSQVSCSLGYAPPEVVNAHADKSELVVEPSLDMWAIGVIVYECLAGCRAFDCGVREVQECAKGSKPYPWERPLQELPRGWRKSRARNVFQGCLSRDPKARPSAADVQQHLLKLSDTSTCSIDRPL
jgi:serine/threonine protein kinase